MNLSIIVLVLLLSTQGKAQPERRPGDVLFWISGGLGAGGPGFAALAKATTVWGNHSLSAKLQLASTISLGGSSGSSIQEYSLYYGRQKISPKSIGRIAAGPAYFIKGGPEYFNRIGLGVEAEAIYKFGPFGLGIMGSLMVAPNILYPHVTLNFSIGKLSYSAE